MNTKMSHNLSVKRDYPRRVSMCRFGATVPPWSAPYLQC